MLNKTNSFFGPLNSICSTPKSALTLSRENKNLRRKSIHNNIYKSSVPNEGQHKNYKQARQAQPNKPRTPTTMLYEQSAKDLVKSMTNNFRAKTEGDLSNDKKTGLDSKIYHPDIYHKPKVRKQIFCQVIDSYMKNMVASNKQRSFNRVHSIQSEFRQTDINLQSQTICEINTQNPFNSLANSKAILNISKKRAGTAGYQRKIQRQQQSSTKIHQGVIKYNKCSNKPTNDISDSQKTLMSKMKVNGRYNAKDKAKQKFKTIASMYRQQKNKTIGQPSYNPENQLSNSNCNSIDSHSQIQDFVQTQLNMRNHKNNARESCRNISTHVQQQRYKHRTRYGMQHSALSKREDKIYIKDNTQLIADNQQGNWEQIKENVKLLGPEYSKKKLNLSVFHRHSLFTIFLLREQHSQEFYEADHTRQSNVHELKKNGKQVSVRIKVKEFKDTLQSSKMGSALEKILQYGVSHIWAPLPSRSQKLDTDKTLYYSPWVKPLRQQLFQFRREDKMQGVISYRIDQKKAYKELFYNNCEYFRDIIISVARDLIKMKGNIINNKISLDNLYRLQQKCLKVGDWGCAAFKRKLIVGDKEVAFRDEPILKVQQQQGSLSDHKIKYSWLLSPQCLPPEIISCIISGNYSQIWQLEECPQTWSLGIMIFQILTGVPVWMPELSAVGHKIPKKGIFYDEAKRLPVIYSLQSKMPNIVARWIRDEKGSDFFNQIHPQILNLMKQMLITNTKMRPKPEDIIRRLSKTDFKQNI